MFDVRMILKTEVIFIHTSPIPHKVDQHLTIRFVFINTYGRKLNHIARIIRENATGGYVTLLSPSVYSFIVIIIMKWLCAQVSRFESWWLSTLIPPPFPIHLDKTVPLIQHLEKEILLWRFLNFFSNFSGSFLWSNKFLCLQNHKQVG